MRSVLFLKHFTLSCVVLGLVGCTHNGLNRPEAFSESGSGQGLSENGAKSYALEGNSRYTGQVRRNSYGQIINPRAAPTDQTYYFDLDSNIIYQGDYEALVVQANYLASHPKTVIWLEGNTDNRGSREYNIALGWRRDQAVERFLEQHGVLHSQIKKVSYGKERPAVIGNNDYAWRLNRRVNLIYEVK